MVRSENMMIGGATSDTQDDVAVKQELEIDVRKEQRGEMNAENGYSMVGRRMSMMRNNMELE